MRNPYAQRDLKMVKTGASAREAYRHADSRELLVGANDEINAGSKKELIAKVMAMVEAASRGEIAIDMKPAQDWRSLEATLTASTNDPAKFRMIGETLGDDIWLTTTREGFSRKFLIQKTLGPGEIAQFRVRQQDVVAYVTSSDANVVASVVRNRWAQVQEFFLQGGILIDAREIAQSTGEILEEKYQDGLAQILVQEDRVWKRLADAAAANSNNLFYFGALTPATFMHMATQVRRWNIPATSSLIAIDLWNDIATNVDFAGYYDPVSKYTLITEGILGSLFNIELVTDGFRDPNLKVLNKGDIYMLGSPETLGGIAIRQELQSRPIDTANQMSPHQGWYFWGVEGMGIINSRAIVKGSRL